jgi:FtsP/CotA-like multicopper oxidase with cupredoxin domain
MNLPQPAQDDGASRWVLAVFALFLIVGVLPITAVGVASVLSDDGDTAGAAAASPTVIDVELSEFAISGASAVPAGPVTLRVTNSGTMQHDLVIDSLGVKTPLLSPGESHDLELGTVTEGSFEMYCSVAGHKESGMSTTLTVSAAAQGDAPTTLTAAPAEGDEADWAAIDHAMHASMLEFPAETEGVGNAVLEPTILPDGTKEFELTGAITPWEVEPGKIVDAWSYNGIVPGPQLRLEVGDRVRVVFHNELPISADIHWHGIRVENSQDGVAPYTQDAVEPGETFVYEFQVTEPMVGMYHAHHAGQHAIPNGMFATIIVGDLELPRGRTISGIDVPADLQVAQELPMVLNDSGVIGLTLDGKSFPATTPVVATQGDWILLHYYNEGGQVHPMHLHGFPQLIVARDGIPLDSPYWADTINVAPGERWSVLINARDPGTWVWHCHIINHVERDEGMFGMVTAMVVEPA